MTVHSLDMPIRLFMSDKSSDNIHFSNMYIFWYTVLLQETFTVSTYYT